MIKSGMSIFSTENYRRICNEQNDARSESKKLSLSKIVNKERKPDDNFFYDYKKMSMSSSNLYRALKSSE